MVEIADKGLSLRRSVAERRGKEYHKSISIFIVASLLKN